MRAIGLVLAVAFVPAIAVAQSPTWAPTVLVNAADAGNLHDHQARYAAASDALGACAAAHPPTAERPDPGVFSMWIVTESADAAPVADLQMTGLLTAAPDGGSVWGDEAAVFDDALTTCVIEALGAVESAGAGAIYLTIEFGPGA